MLPPNVIIRNNIQQADEKWAKEAADKIVEGILSISAATPLELRNQALAFRDDIWKLVFKHTHKTVRLAVTAERESFAKLKG